MPEYAFILGRDPELSILEIVSLLARKGVPYTIVERTREVLILGCDAPEERVKSFMPILGGTVKIGRSIASFDELRIRSSRIFFGVNNLNASKKRNESLKSFFKQQRVKAMQKYTSEMIINPSRALHLDCELIFFKEKMFEVISVANPREYRSRDENRPFFDAKSVVSIRLAKILINLSQVKDREVVLDPFVGLGTIGQEALLMGLSFVGTDKNPEVVVRCEKNLKWTGKNKYAVHTVDVTRLSECVKHADVVVSEPYLGPYLKRLPSEREASMIVRDLSVMFRRAFLEFRKVGVKRVAFIFPYFVTRTNKTFKLPVESILAESGFRVASLVNGIALPVEYKPERSKVKRLVYVVVSH